MAALSLSAPAKTERDLCALRNLWLRTQAVWLAARAIRRANEKNKNVAHEWLYHRLSIVWLDHFGRELAYSRPSRGGLPRGPLIEFILAAFQQVVAEDALPGAEAVAKAIARERIGRERCRQLILQLQ